MKHLNPSFNARMLRHTPGYRQRGVLLIVTLILLLVISGIAALSIKGAGSTEAVANNARTQALAMQVAEAALRYCEMGAINSNITAKGKSIPTPGPTHSFTILATPVLGATPTWQDITSWQSSTPLSVSISLSDLDSLGSSSSSGGSSTFALVYKRSPDCIAQYADAASTMAWVTARGFGPEVAATNSTGDIPFGSEVFLHSTLRLPVP